MPDADRHYTPDMLGPACASETCGLALPLALANAGFNYHPTCHPTDRDLMKAARRG